MNVREHRDRSDVRAHMHTQTHIHAHTNTHSRGGNTNHPINRSIDNRSPQRRRLIHANTLMRACVCGLSTCSYRYIVPLVCPSYIAPDHGSVWFKGREFHVATNAGAPPGTSICLSVPLACVCAYLYACIHTDSAAFLLLPPPPLPNHTGESVEITCHDHYRLSNIGSSRPQCLPTGQWEVSNACAHVCMCVCVCVCVCVCACWCWIVSLSADPSLFLFIFTHMTHRWFLDFPLHLSACLTSDAIRAGGQDQSADISIHLSIYLRIEDTKHAGGQDM